MEPTFFLFAEEDRGGTTVTAWLKRGGTTFRTRHSFQPSFLVAAVHRPLSHVERLFKADSRIKALRRTTAVLWLKGKPQEVLEVWPHRYTELTRLATHIERQLGCTNYEIYNIDVPIPSRWAQEHGLFPFAKVEWDGKRLAVRDDRWTLDYTAPDLRCIRLRVEGGPSYDDPLTEIQWGDRVIPARSRERDALLDLARLIDADDPDVYLTNGGDGWDVPYLLHRIRANGLRREVQLGRLPDPAASSQKERSFHTYGTIKYRGEGWFLRGRLHFDLSKKFLPELQDRDSLHGILYLARTSNTDPQRMARNSPGSCVQQVHIDRALEEGVQIPWKRNLVEALKPLTVMVAVDRGGQIHVPTPGVYDDSWGLDFGGYYPSLIVEHNLSSETINCDCCPDSDKLVPGTTWHICVRRVGHQTRSMAPFVEHRRHVAAVMRRAEANGNEAGVAAALRAVETAWASAIKDELKAVGVVSFGYARYKHARFGCAEVHQAIQAFGRDGMTRAKRMAEDAGFERLHTLTDGMVIRKVGATRAEVARLARRISLAVGVPMSIDAEYEWVVFLPSNSVLGIGVPNRYYGKKRDGALKVRGIEVRRHNTSPWLRRSQERVLDVLAQARNAAAFCELVPQAIAEAKACAAELASVPLEDLAITVTVTREVEDYTQMTHARVALGKLRDAGIPVHPGQGLSYVVLRDSTAAAAQRAVPVQLLHREGPLGRQPLRANVDHYLGLLARSMETLLAPLGYTEDALLDALQGRATRQARLPAAA